MNGLHNIREYLDYCPKSGVFRWVKRPRFSSAVVGAMAGSYDRDGYRRIKFGGIEYRTGRLAWFFLTGALPPDDIEIDHLNLIRSDDRSDNLRLATGAQNKRNRGPLRKRRTRHSRYKGVSRFVRTTGKWSASIYSDSRLRHLGVFDDEKDAALAYDVAAVTLHGEFARLNFPETT